VDSLLEDARRLRDAGDLPASFARLERALRIAPQRAEVYLELARTHRAAQRPERASASAERGLLYCGGDVCTELRRFIAP
jgi:tetratricopeptide (TPR) repeat protein